MENISYLRKWRSDGNEFVKYDDNLASWENFSGSCKKVSHGFRNNSVPIPQGNSDIVKSNSRQGNVWNLRNFEKTQKTLLENLKGQFKIKKISAEKLPCDGWYYVLSY